MRETQAACTTAQYWHAWLQCADHDEDEIRVPHILQLVRDQQARATREVALNAVVEEEGPDMRIHCTQGIIQQQRVAVGVDGARECTSRLLPATQVDASLADVRAIALRQDLDVVAERRMLDRLSISLGIPRRSEQHILLERGVDDHGGLRAVSHGARQAHRAAGALHLAQQSAEQR